MIRWRQFTTKGSLALLVHVAAHASEPVDLTVVTTAGQAYHLADQRGRWVLVNYWATWCSSCLAEMPALSRFAERQSRLVVVGLTDESLTDAALRTFLTLHAVTYPVAMVDRRMMPAALPTIAFGIGMRPLSYLVAPDGTVVDRFIGEIDLPKLEARVREQPR